MEKEFIPWEEALELKKLGFDEECLGLFYGTSIKEEAEFLLEFKSSQYYAEKGYIDGILVPLWQQAFDFLLKFIPQYSIRTCYNGTGEISTGVLERHIFHNKLECLKKLIELIKNK